jgi:ferredoxin--NADP+ reductase
MAKPTDELKVLSVQHYTDRLFKFRVDRPKSFRFKSGQFVMIGLMVDGEPLMRAYSMASSCWDDELEFFSIKVPNGPLTSHLKHIQAGDSVLIGGKAVGSLVIQSLKPGRRLFLVSTGTGIAPFASITRDPETYERFEQVYLTHTCREVAELTYGKELAAGLQEDPLCSEFASQLTHYTSVTREDYPFQGRITDCLESQKFFKDLGIEGFDPEHDRVMICGSIEMNKDMKTLLEGQGFAEGSQREKGEFVIERAFVG